MQDQEHAVAIGSDSELSGPLLIDAARQCCSSASIAIGFPGQESLAVHLLWNAIRLRLCCDCHRFLAGNPDEDAELHDIAMHLSRHTGDDSYGKLARELLPFDGVGKILVNVRKGRIKPFSYDQYENLRKISNLLEVIAPTVR